MKKNLSRARVGFLLFVGVITFVVAIFLVGEKSQLFSSTYIVQANFPAAEGVKRGSFVVLSGYNIGTVTDIQLTPKADSVRVLMRVSESVHPFIKPDSRAEIKQEGLVGNKIINIEIGSSSLPPVENYGFIQGTPAFALTSLADNVTAITDTTKLITGQIYTLLKRLNSGDGTLGKLLNDDAIFGHVLSITQKTDSGLGIATTQLINLSALLTRVTKSVDILVGQSDSTVMTVNRITGEIETLTRNINHGKGTVGALLSDRKLYDSLVALIGALTDVSYDASNAANQAAQSIHSMREHWLFGRIFGGDDFEKEPLPEPSFKKMMRELNHRSKELEEREKRVHEWEKKLGISGDGKEK